MGPCSRPDRRQRVTAALVAGVAFFALGACGGGKSGGSPGPSSAGASALPAGTCGRLHVPPQFRHVVLVVLENHSYDQVIGSGHAPYLNTLAQSCGLALDSRAVAHPSLPNYLALVSGSTQSVTDDAGPDKHHVYEPSIFGELKGDWRVLADGMPSACFGRDIGRYAVRHNPALYFDDAAVDCKQKDVPLGKVPDLSAAFTLLVPDLCHDAHDCSVATSDSWLAGEVPLLLATPQYREGDTAIVITFDEDDRSAHQHIATIALAPSIPAGTKVATRMSHYALLRTIADLIGVRPPGLAAVAPDVCVEFHLCAAHA